MVQSAGWLTAGYVVSATGVNPFLSILFFELPFTLHCWQKGYLANHTPLMVYGVCLLVFAVIFGLGLWAGLTFSYSDFPLFSWTIGACSTINLIDLIKNDGYLTDFIEENAAYLSAAGYQALDQKRHKQPTLSPSLAQQHTPPSPTARLFGRLKQYLCIRIKIGNLEIGIE